MKVARLVPVLVLVLASCGGSDGPVITSKELATIMPSAIDAPPGTGIRTDVVGARTLEEFVPANDVRSTLRSLGFRSAYVATFASAGFPEDPEKAPTGSALYGTSAIVLRDADAAHEGFAFYEARLRTRAKNLTPIVAQNLGSESFSFHFSSLEDSPLPGVAYLFRVGNALFSVVGVGNPDPQAEPPRGLAELIASRAEKA